MSAWLVSEEHIDLLVTAGLVKDYDRGLTWSTSPDRFAPRELTQDIATVVGGMLWAENYASVEKLYPDVREGGQVPGQSDEFEAEHTLTYTFTPIPGDIDWLVVLKAVSCYEYQSCEHDGWETSEAKRFGEALTHRAISNLPGYDKAPWGFDDREYFLTHAG